MGSSRRSSDISNLENPDDQDAPNKKCIFVCDNPTEPKLLKVTDKILNLCKEKVVIRRKIEVSHAKLKFPGELNETHYYHSNCAKSFIALKEKYLDK